MHLSLQLIMCSFRPLQGSRINDISTSVLSRNSCLSEVRVGKKSPFLSQRNNMTVTHGLNKRAEILQTFSNAFCLENIFVCWLQESFCECAQSMRDDVTLLTSSLIGWAHAHNNPCDWYLTEVFCLGSISQYVSIVSGNGLAPNRWVTSHYLN